MLRPCLTTLALPLTLIAAGCGASGPLAPLDAAEQQIIADVAADAHTSYLYLTDVDPAEPLPMYDGRTGEPVTGSDLQRRLSSADVIVIGELHDDAVAGSIEARLAAAALPGSNGGAVTLEALERGTSARESLSNWPAEGAGYRPILRVADDAGVAVAAVNAPREYAAQAREEGLSALAGQPQNGDLYVLPKPSERRELRHYRRRFEEVFSELDAAHATATSRPSTRASTQPAGNRRGERVSDFYDAQLVWDATMADGIARTYRRSGGPVVHVVGGFHSDYDGGLPTLLRLRGLDVLTISLLPVDASRLRSEDVGRANVVIYTGPPASLSESTLPATRPTTEPAEISL